MKKKGEKSMKRWTFFYNNNEVAQFDTDDENQNEQIRKFLSKNKYLFLSGESDFYVNLELVKLVTHGNQPDPQEVNQKRSTQEE